MVRNYFLALKDIPIIPITSAALPEPVDLKGCLLKSYSAINFIVSPFFTGYGPTQGVIDEIVLILAELFPPLEPPWLCPEPPIPASESDLSPYTAADEHVNLSLRNRDTLTPPSIKFQSTCCICRRGRNRTMQMTPCAKYVPVFYKVKLSASCISCTGLR